MRILAIDVGDKKIGLAVGDTVTRLAFARPPLMVDSWSEAWAPLRHLVGTEHIERIVVGWPLNDNGTAGPQADRIELFIVQLAAQVDIPIVKRDERHSTIAVQREQRAADRRLQPGQEDSLAAQLLAESLLSEKP